MQTFHIGYPKCGSKTIQAILQSAQIPFLGKPYATSIAEYHVRESLTFGDLRQVPHSTLKQIRDVICAGEPIVSDEILSGVGFAHSVAANSLLQIVDNIELVTRGDFVAYALIRRPEDFLRSYHGQMVRMGAKLSFDRFCSLVLMRPHHWVLRSLDFASLLRSRHALAGKLRFVLFEDIFLEGHLWPFLRSAFGIVVPSAPPIVQLHRSETDATIDYAAARMPSDPSSWLELQATRPSFQEHRWIERMGEKDREMHELLWAKEREEAGRLAAEARSLLEEARNLYGAEARKRPVSDPFAALLKKVSEVNADIEEELAPNLDFKRHRYFEIPREHGVS